MQGECRRLRSQVSDLEQRNVALNLLLTQSLRDSMLTDNIKKPADHNNHFNHHQQHNHMVKSNSYDVTTTTTTSGSGNGSGNSSNPRDSLCSTVSDSEIRLNSNTSIFENSPGGVRPLVSKDSNWTMSSTSSSSSTSQAALSVQQSAEQNPVERAEKLLAVLKHRLFSAQLNSYKSIRLQPRHNEMRRSLVLPDQSPMMETSLPARPSTLAFCPTASSSCGSGSSSYKEATANDPSTPSVRALVQVLEKRVANPLPAGQTTEKTSPRPPLPVAPVLMRTIRNAAAVVTGEVTNNDSPASKDEGYSTMSSDVQVLISFLSLFQSMIPTTLDYSTVYKNEKFNIKKNKQKLTKTNKNNPIGGFFVVEFVIFHRFRLFITGHFTSKRQRIDCQLGDSFVADGQT